jgi:tripartite-type tricarboxylate transporter receptor subunit TctC
MFKSMHRRRVTVLLISAALALVTQISHAQTDWPKRPVTIVVGFSAGGTTDIIARLLGQELSKTWGQPVIVDNRPGAGGNIAAGLTARAKPDGYTLFMGSNGPLAANSSLFKSLPFDSLKDFSPISMVADVPNMLIVNPRVMPVSSFKEFIALTKANPGKYFFGSTGHGTASHLSAELLKMESGIDVTHVPYKGAVALNDLLGGESVQFMFATIPSVIQHVRSGKLRAIAVTSRQRSSTAPDVPTIAESGFPGFEASAWFGLVGPAGMSRELTHKIQEDIGGILKRKVIHDKFIAQGADPRNLTPEQFADYMRSETKKWAKVIKLSGATLE